MNQSLYLCRACCQPCDIIGVPLTPENSVITSDLEFLLKGHLPQPIDPELYPKWMCQECLDQLTKSVTFLRQAINSHNYHANRNIINIPDDEEEEPEIITNDLNLNIQKPKVIMPRIPAAKANRTCKICFTEFKSEQELLAHLLGNTPCVTPKPKPAPVPVKLKILKPVKLKKKPQITAKVIKNTNFVPKFVKLNDVRCQFCTKIFISPEKLNQHIKLQHAFLVCGNCGKKYPSDDQIAFTSHLAMCLEGDDCAVVNEPLSDGGGLEP